jgi:ParB family chromosome partitioning protein
MFHASHKDTIMVKKRGLGKSLDALLAYASDAHKQPEETLCQLPVDVMQRGKYQPRREMDAQALEDLANSIRNQGIIQPLIVRPIGDKYEIIAGERRWRAAQLAGLTEVPAIIRNIPDEAAIAVALIENIQREDLNPIDEASALQRLIEEFSMTHQQVAEAVGKSRTSVTNLLRLLALPEEVKSMLERGFIEMGHARTLITLPESSLIKTAEIIASRGLSVREAEEMVRRLHSPQAPKEKTPVNPNILGLQEHLSRQLSLPVAISHNHKGKGKLVIQYRNLTELNELMAKFEEHVVA